MLGEQARLDARNLRGIAHPLRIRMLGLLRSEGPATATMLARRLGINTGATSYHLRQLAEYGFVTEDAGRGNHRERWWRSAHENTALTDATLVADDSGLGAAFLHAVARTQADNVLRAADAFPTLPEQWRRALTLNDYVLTLTAAQATQLAADLHEVVQRHRAASPGEHGDAGPAEDAGPVTVQILVVPHERDAADDALDAASQAGQAG